MTTDTIATATATTNALAIASLVFATTLVADSIEAVLAA